MTIRIDLVQGRTSYHDRYDRNPDLLFISLQTYEDILHDPNTDLSKDFNNFYGCEVITVNSLNIDYIFFEKTDLDVALEKYISQRTQLITIPKHLPSHSTSAPTNSKLRSIEDDFTLENLQIEEKIIVAYRQSQESKKLDF
ncbi:hypothetical protein Q4S33_14040 [Acinetobacter calcoaceticus]|nr:hypothetical protein Q4S33_14040 [Acinetobacter calcoaceticus]